MKRLVKAAITYKGNIFTGWRHCEIGIAMVKNGDCPRPYPYNPYQGFVDEEGEFIYRDYAYEIAVEAGQVIAGETHQEGYLFSEDVWDVNGNPKIKTGS